MTLAALLLFSACGDDDSGGAGDGTSDSESTSGTEDDGGTSGTGDGGGTSGTGDGGSSTGDTSDDGSTGSETGGTSASDTTGGATSSDTTSGDTTTGDTATGTTTGTTTTHTATGTTTTTDTTTTTTTDTTTTTTTTTTSLLCADTCGGCCVGQTCMAGDTDAACGTGGNTCQPCAGWENCVTHSCELDMAAQWTLTVVSATINGQYDNGGPGSCYSSIVDAYVTVILDVETGTSDVVEETTTPVWNDILITDPAGSFTGNVLMIYLYDDDGDGACSGPDPIDNCAHQVDEADLQAGGFTIDFCGTQVLDLVFELDPT